MAASKLFDRGNYAKYDYIKVSERGSPYERASSSERAHRAETRERNAAPLVNSFEKVVADNKGNRIRIGTWICRHGAGFESAILIRTRRP